MEIKKIYEEGQPIAPITHPNAVLDEYGNDEAVRTDMAIENKINEHHLIDNNEAVEIFNEVAGDTLKLVKSKFPNLLLEGVKDDRKIDINGNVSAGGGYCKARKITVEPNTCYYINRPYSIDGSNINRAVWLEDSEGNITPPLNSDGSEREHTYKLYQIFGSCGVIKTRSDSAYMHVGFDYYGGGANGNMLLSEYCIKHNHPVLYDEYYEEPQLADNLNVVKKKFKVLLIGSSYGQNTICALAPLAIAAGIDITVGNLYAGSITLADQLSRAINDTSWNEYWHMTKYDNLYIGETDGYSSRGIKPTVRNVLNDDDWDCVILMRSASECNDQGWTDTDSANLQALIDFIEENCPSHPKVVWNSGFAYPIYWSGVSTREIQQPKTDRMMEVCETVKSTIGIDYIPIAKAVQLCRNDTTVNSSRDLGDGSEHLNNGIGMYVTACCCFEYFFKSLFYMSVRTQTKIHTFDELGYRRGTNPSNHINVHVLTGTNFTAPTSEQARLIRKYVQIACNE